MYTHIYVISYFLSKNKDKYFSFIIEYVVCVNQKLIVLEIENLKVSIIEYREK